MTAAVTQELFERCLGQHLARRWLMPEQNQLQCQDQRRVEGQQLAVTAHLQRRQPFGLVGRLLMMAVVRGGRIRYMSMPSMRVMLFQPCGGLGHL